MARKAKNDGTPPGPVPKQINIEMFESLCQLWCTQMEIAAHFRMDVKTLIARVEEHYGEDFSVIYKRLYDSGTPSFRRERRVLARKNAAMSIWLGKMCLGEKEENVQSNDGLNLMKIMRLLEAGLIAQKEKPPEMNA